MKIKGGTKGKSFNDRELAGKVRSLALNQVVQVLKGELYDDDKTFHKALLLKMSSNLLPRLNELTGEDGESLISGIEINVRK